MTATLILRVWIGNALVFKVSFSLAIKNDWKWLFNIEFTDSRKYPYFPIEGIGTYWGCAGGLVRPKNFKKSMKLNWNFHRGRGLRNILP